MDNEWQGLSDNDLLYHIGRIRYLIHKFHEDNKAGLLDPEKAKEDIEYYNDICRDLADCEYALEDRGYYEDEDTGEWIAPPDLT